MVRPLRFLLVALALGSLTFQVSAQTVPVVVSPYSVVATGTSGTNLTGMAVYEAKAAQTAANARYYSRAVAFSEVTVANGVRSRVALGPALAISAAVLAAGWALDQITGQISQPSTLPLLPPNIVSWRVDGFNTYYGSTVAAANGYISYTAGATSDSVLAVGWNGVSYKFYSPSRDRYVDVKPNYAAGFTPPAGYNPGAATSLPAPVADGVLAALIRNNPATWPEVLTTPNGFPRVLTPMPQQMTDVQAQYRIDTGLTPLPSGTPEPIAAPIATPTTSPLPNAEPLPLGSVAPPPATPTPSAVTFPVFCTWASKVCEFFDWMKTDPPSDTTYLGPLDPPTVDLGSTAVEWDSGLGDGTCPAPASVTVLGQTHEMTFQPVCDLAVGGRIFVLISATLGAGLLLMRVFV